MTHAKSQESLFDSLVEQVLMEFRNAAQTVGPVKELKSKLNESVYDSLGVKDYNDIFADPKISNEEIIEQLKKCY